jgi:hypothetical protein
LEAGSSVVALCYDEHHRKHLQQYLSQRVVEAMVTGTTQVFKDSALLARSVQLNLTMPVTPMAASANKKRTEETASSDEQEIEAKHTAKKKREQRKSETTPRKTKQKKALIRHRQKRNATVRFARFDSPATDNDGESYGNSDTDSKDVKRTPPAKKLKGHRRVS